jgi:pimeloyl-ACP methyl ester carboxylesterase
MLASFVTMQDQLRAAAPHADAIVATAEGRRRATELLVTNYEHIPPELVAHIIQGVASAPGARAMVEYAMREGYPTLDAERIACPVRIVWGTTDRLLPWPAAAARFRRDWLPHADWVELEGIGHCPQLDVPLETAELILGFRS